MTSRINQILNISSKEWPRILVAWSMIFLTRFGFIVGWSVLTAIFLGEIGIDWLPVLFLINASLVMLGTLFFRQIIHLVRREVLITFTVIAAAALLICSTLFLETNSMYFFGLVLIAESVLLAQLIILLSLFNEELFTPLESQRTFPVIESAETIGGIAGGLALSLFAYNTPSYKFIIIWALALLLILPIVLKFNARTMDVPKIEEAKHKKPGEKLYEGFATLRKIPFLKFLMIIIILHWAIMNVVEFQYTKAIQQEVYSMQENTLVMQEETHEIALASEATDEHYTEHQVQDFEHQIAYKLGFLHMIFNAAALAIQLVLASRILTSVGIISSMLLHPLITLLNLAGLTLRFGFFTAALTRGTYELTNLIFKNAYDSSYYAIPHEQRSDVKELMQGIMKPLGAIGGTVCILVIASHTTGLDQTLVLNGLLIGMGVAMAALIASLSKRYTAISEKNLSRKVDLPTRLNAVEILAQKGHEKKTPSLQKILNRKDEPEILKQSILKTLGAQQDTEAIDSILKALHNKKSSIRLAAIQALGQFEELKKKKMDHAFTRHRVIETLKERLLKEANEGVREELIHCFHTVSASELTKFIIKVLEEHADKRHTFIRMLKLFKDPNLKPYLEPHLNSKDPELKAASIIALWQFNGMHLRLEHHLKQMLNSKNTNCLKLGVEVSGQIKYKKAKPQLKSLLNHTSKEIRHAAILALGQMEDESIIPHMIGLFSDPDHEWFKQTKPILASLPKKFKYTVETALHLHVTNLIAEILAPYKKVEEIEKDTLKHLKSLYKKIDAHHEVHKIKKLLEDQ